MVREETKKIKERTREKNIWKELNVDKKKKNEKNKGKNIHKRNLEKCFLEKENNLKRKTFPEKKK